MSEYKFLSRNNKQLNKKGKKHEKIKRIIVNLLIVVIFFMNSANLLAGTVQAASTSFVKKAYKKYLIRV